MFKEALGRAELIVFTGGLGPTDDDLTREVVADVLGLPLETDDRIVSGIEQRFARRGMTMPAVNIRQAHGTARRGRPRQHEWHRARTAHRPGSTADRSAARTAARSESDDRRPVRWPAARARRGRSACIVRRLFVTGRSESHVEEASQPLYAHGATRIHRLRRRSSRRPVRSSSISRSATRTPDAHGRGSHERATICIEPWARCLQHRRPVDGGDRRRAALARGYTIAAAESCTGGLLMARLTDVPGSSRYVHGGGRELRATRRRPISSTCPPR